MAPRIPLTSRPLDLLYFTFFLTHIPATILMDLQALYPTSYIPSILTSMGNTYLEMTHDPVIAGAFGLNGPIEYWSWFRSFLVLEAFFQLPIFFIGLYGLYNNKKSIYPLLLIYATSSATTTIPCLVTLLRTPLVPSHPFLPSPSPSPSASSGPGANHFPSPLEQLTITPKQLVILLSSYIPFLAVPLLMVFDMALRVGKGLALEERVERGGVGRDGELKLKLKEGKEKMN